MVEIIAGDNRSPDERLAAILAEPRPFVDPRTLPVRFHRLKQLGASAAHYLLACQEPDDAAPDTIALRMGAGFHGALFEKREIVCYDGRRAGKAWDKFEAEHTDAGHIIVVPKEHAIVRGMIDAVRRHPRAMELLFRGIGSVETRIDWTEHGRSVRGTPDVEGTNGLVDLKSTRCAEPGWFAREAIKRAYHVQLVHYEHGLVAARGRRWSDSYLIAVENVAPFNVVVMRLTDEARLAAEKLLRTWWERLLAAEALGHYGGYVETDVDLELPEWAREPELVGLDDVEMMS